MSSKLKLGIQSLIEGCSPFLTGKRIGVVSNHTGVTPELEHLVDVLYFKLHLDVRAIFAPEHGFRGDMPEGFSVESYVDERTQLPVHSLYGARLKPSKEILSEIDALIYDVQDVGARFYTYISTLFYVLEAAGETGVEVILLDRPNPITGVHIEGPILDKRYRSFVGIWEIPIRHGMTVGELALMFNEEAGLNANLKVYRMIGWSRGMWFDETGLPWIPPSPNMPCLTTATVYPGICLLEGTNISEGRGTTKPFELVGAPWIDSYKLVEELKSLPLRGVKFRPSTFIPRYRKYEGQLCHGLQIHVTDRNALEPVKLGLAIVWAVERIHPDKLQFNVECYEDTLGCSVCGVGGSSAKPQARYYFDCLIGNDTVRKLIEEGYDFKKVAKLCDEVEHFEKNRRKYLLYD
ncbi:DUF1343 domain-containing protein [Candidatus Bathyarchaeota archaeon]|nr:DUF1343 domain-containing protein [Candidatus Bathyarchaeota archaeon]MBS7612933.1 DUF1343 domain-containing protein [Candidatus Bathyarchaeota archaeon]MBS7618006.1 DUF1343 domain-containing protein [Candidatus Bathyarchaeota archaeon]